MPTIVVASLNERPLDMYICTISSTSRSNEFYTSHYSRSRYAAALSRYASPDTNSPKPIEKPSAITFEKPKTSTVAKLPSPPAAAAMMANVVIMPSSPPKTTDLIY
uniref:Uncharacterized protein n=1 Tax=Lygus hesperus TaxID=30085 RepID=A0A0A9XHJ1_LYGHE